MPDRTFEKARLPKLLLHGAIAASLVLGIGGVVPAIAGERGDRSPTAPAVTNGLSEDNIRAALAAIQKAQDEENVEGMLAYVAPFASSEITVETDDLSTTVNLAGLEEHRDLLKKVFAKVAKREILDRDIKIELTADGQLGIATVYTIKAIATEQGKDYLTADTDTIHFAWIDNRPKIVYLKSSGWLAERPKAKP